MCIRYVICHGSGLLGLEPRTHDSRERSSQPKGRREVQAPACQTFLQKRLYGYQSSSRRHRSGSRRAIGRRLLTLLSPGPEIQDPRSRERSSQPKERREVQASTCQTFLQKRLYEYQSIFISKTSIEQRQKTIEKRSLTLSYPLGLEQTDGGIPNLNIYEVEKIVAKRTVHTDRGANKKSHDEWRVKYLN